MRWLVQLLASMLGKGEGKVNAFIHSFIQIAPIHHQTVFNWSYTIYRTATSLSNARTHTHTSILVPLSPLYYTTTLSTLPP